MVNTDWKKNGHSCNHGKKNHQKFSTGDNLHASTEKLFLNDHRTQKIHPSCRFIIKIKKTMQQKTPTGIGNQMENFNMKPYTCHVIYGKKSYGKLQPDTLQQLCTEKV